MKELVGKKIEKILIDDTYQEYMKFVTDGGEFIYHAYGDCCSESYFAEISNAKEAIGRVVEEVEHLDLGAADGTRQDEDTIYGIRVKFKSESTWDKPSLLIIFRNSSNGYYGGSVELTTVLGEKAAMKELASYYDADAVARKE